MNKLDIKCIIPGSETDGKLAGFELMVKGEIDDVAAFLDKYGMDFSGPPLT